MKYNHNVIFIIEITIIKPQQEIIEHIFDKTLAIVQCLRYYCDRNTEQMFCVGRDKMDWKDYKNQIIYELQKVKDIKALELILELIKRLQD